MKHKKLRALCEGAIMVALATALSYLKLLELPQGGSVCIGMLPIFLYSARWGVGPAFLTSFAYGLLQLLLDGAYAWGPTSMLLDYLLAFGVLGVAGFFHRKKGGIFIGTVVGCVCRFIVHFIMRHHDLQDLRADRAVQLHVHQSVSLFRSLQRQLRVHRHGALPRDHGADLQAAEKVHQRHRSCQVKKTAPACAVLQAGAFFYFRVR